MQKLLRCLLLLVLMLGISPALWAQSIIRSQSFETGETVNYTSNTFNLQGTAVTNANNQYFTIATTNPPHSFGAAADPIAIKNADASANYVGNFWMAEAVRAMTNTGTVRDPGHVTLNAFDASGYTGIKVIVALADPRGPGSKTTSGANTSPSTGSFNVDDVITIEYSTDGGNNYITIGRFSGNNSNGSTGFMELDYNLANGVNDEVQATLNYKMTDYTFGPGGNGSNIGIPGSPSSLMVRVVVDQRGTSQELAFDNIRVVGTPTTVRPPTLTDAQTGAVNYTEGAGATQITNTIVATNPEGPNFTGATVSIISGLQATEDLLDFTAVTGITGSYAASTGVLTFSGQASVASYQAVLRTVTYRNSNPTTARGGNRAVQFVVNNGASTSSGLIRNVLVKAILGGPAPLPYTEDFSNPDGEGVRYGSNAFVGTGLTGSGFAFTRTNAIPYATGEVSFSNVSNGYYWYGVNIKSGQNPSGVGRLETQQVNAAGYANLRFQIRLGAESGPSAAWQASDSFMMYYRTGGSTGTWKLFGSFRGNTTSINGIADMRQDRPEDLGNLPAVPAGTATLTPALTNFDFALPTDANGQQVDFKMELINDDLRAEFAFDLIQVTGTLQVAPTVTTTAPASITGSSAVLGGNVTADGAATVTERGVVYSTTNNVPTTSNTKDPNGSGTGIFSETVALAPGTTYYARAYAINSVGTSYGAVQTFTTPTTIVSIVRAGANPTNASQVPFTLTFATPITGLTTTGNFSLTTTGALTGASVASVSGSGTTYTVVVNTGSNSGTLRLNLGSSAGLSPTVSNLPFTGGEAYDIDKTRPSVAVSSSVGASGSTTTTSPIPFTVTFSENVTSFAASDVTVTGGTVTGFSGSGTTYTVSVTPPGSGIVTVTVPASAAQDAAGNFNTAAPASFSLTYNQPNTTVASVTRLTPSFTTTATATVSFRVVFGASVTGVSASNFLVTGPTGAGIATNGVSGSGTTYTVTVNTGTGNGTLTLNVQNGTGISPTVTNAPYTSGEQYSIIKSFPNAPLLTLRGTGSASGNYGDVSAFVDQVQVVQNGTSTTVAGGLQNSSFEGNNVSAAAGSFLYGSPAGASPWTLGSQTGVSRNGTDGFSSTAADGTAVAFLQNGGTNSSVAQKLAVPTGSYQVNFQARQRTNNGTSDQAVNVFLNDGTNDVFIGRIEPSTSYQSFTSAAFSVTAPALTATVSSTAAATGGTTTTSPLPFAVSFSQSVGTSFVSTDVTVTNGTITTGSFAGSSAGPYTFTVTPTTPGTATTVSLAAGVAQDANNTLNTASNAYGVTYNQLTTAAPVVTVPPNGSTTNATPSFGGTAPAGSTVLVYVDGVQNGGTITASATTGSWVRSFAGTALTRGTHTVYATAQLAGQAVSLPSPTNTFTVQIAATYTSSAAAQASTDRVAAGSTNQAILQVAIVIGGGPDAPLSATSFSFTTSGSTSPADIAAARVYYTGTSSSFVTTNQFGSPRANPNGSFTITGSQQLVNGTNYFWLVYDVAPGATIGNVLDATAPSFVISDGSFPSTRNPTTPAPAGNRQIVTTSRTAGTALRATGGATAGYVDFSASTTPAPLLNGSYTQSAWFRLTLTQSSAEYYLLGNGLRGASAAPFISVTGNGRIQAGFSSSAGSEFVRTGPNTLVDGQWNHLVASYDAASRVLMVYQNGEEVIRTTAAAGPNSPNRLNYIGAAASAGPDYLPGDLDEVSVWSRALSQTEIRQLRHLTLGGLETGLASYLQFNDNGITTTDGIGGTVGTLTGSTTRVASTAPVGSGTSNLQTVAANTTYSFAGTNVNMVFTGVTGSSETVVFRLDGQPLGTQPSAAGLQRIYKPAYWIVDKYVGGTFTSANVTYTLTPADISAADAATPANLKLFKRGSNADGTFETPISATAANATAGTVTFPVTSFSQTVIGTLGSSPLPVELEQFTAEQAGSAALLRWATAQELNNDYFAVEVSENGRTFSQLGTVAGTGTTSRRTEYQFRDQKLLTYGSGLVYYRLRQVDYDGAFSYSPVRTVAVGSIETKLALFPNPATGTTTLTGAKPGTNVQLYDALGRLVLTAAADAAGSAALVLPQGLGTGVYVVRAGAAALRLSVE